MIIVSQKKHALFIFRRDLRISDNTALIAADNQAKKISLLFIFDPRQIETDRKSVM